MGYGFLLGFAEAGFFPGVILYLTYWFPSRRRGEMIALFMLAMALTGVIGAPLSGWILHQFSGAAGTERLADALFAGRNTVHSARTLCPLVAGERSSICAMVE